METPASVAAVVELLGKLNAQVASYVQRRLQELAAQTKNVAVRETIERLGLAAR
jgi:anti-anti-sigma regulatory factor